MSVPLIKIEVGATKQEITREEAVALGAEVFTMRLHVFVPARDRAQVFLNLIPGTPATLPAEIMQYNGLESFPVVSFPLKSRDNREFRPEIFPPADPGLKCGVYSLGLLNTLAIPAGPPGDEQEVKIDPRQLVRCTR